MVGVLIEALGMAIPHAGAGPKSHPNPHFAGVDAGPESHPRVHPHPPENMKTQPNRDGPAQYQTLT
jgi:hypothetical protein